MSGAFQYLDIDSDEFLDAPKALRDHAKKLQRELEKVTGEVSTLRTQLHERSIAEVLADKGFKNPTRVQKDMLADQVDPADTAAVEAWLAVNSDDYARVDDSPAPEPDPAAEAAQPDDAADFQRLALSGAQPGGTADPFQTALAKAGKDATKEELRAAFIEAGL